MSSDIRGRRFRTPKDGQRQWAVPSAALNFPSTVPGITAHNWQAGVTPTSTMAHKGMVSAAKVLAGAILDFLSKPLQCGIALHQVCLCVAVAKLDGSLP